MVEWQRHADHDLCGSDDADSDYAGDNSDTLSTGVGDDDLTTDSAGQSLAVAVARGGEAGPSFGNIAITNSADVHFGNKTFYNGPVTIKQLVYANSVDESQEDAAGRWPSIAEGAVFLSPPKTAAEDKSEPVQRINGNFNTPPTDPSKASNEQDAERGALNKWVSNFVAPRRMALVVATVGVALLLVTLLILALTLWRQGGDPSSKEIDSSKTPGYEVVGYHPTEFNITSSNLTIKSRKEWLAQPVTTPPEALMTPVPYVIIDHTVTEICLTHADCVLRVRLLQTYDIESRGFWDIKYNFLVGGNGFVYVGRSWNAVGSHAYGYNNRSIGIGFIGTFKSVAPSEKQTTACLELIKLGIELDKISKDYKLLDHEQVAISKTPAVQLLQEIKTWPHWSESP